MANKPRNTVRVNITVSNELKNWYVEQSEKAGMSMASLMSMALYQYSEQKEGMKALSNISMLNEMMKGISKE